MVIAIGTVIGLGLDFVVCSASLRAGWDTVSQPKF